jgi:hypothetical protein
MKNDVYSSLTDESIWNLGIPSRHVFTLFKRLYERIASVPICLPS